MPAGYSKTPLAKKLGIKAGQSVLLVNQPDYYLKLFNDLPSVQMVNARSKEEVDFIHLFILTKATLEKHFVSLKNRLSKTGLMWISWPKGKSGIPTDVKRDWIREYGLENGLVDVKVAAVDEKWSGLKFVYRLEDR